MTVKSMLVARRPELLSQHAAQQHEGPEQQLAERHHELRRRRRLELGSRVAERESAPPLTSFERPASTQEPNAIHRERSVKT
jgi:hypothetical protein